MDCIVSIRSLGIHYLLESHGNNLDWQILGLSFLILIFHQIILDDRQCLPTKDNLFVIAIQNSVSLVLDSLVMDAATRRYCYLVCIDSFEMVFHLFGNQIHTSLVPHRVFVSSLHRVPLVSSVARRFLQRSSARMYS